MTHAVIIGGTGMLAEASREIARHFDQTTLIARHPQKLAGEIGADAISMDWTNKKSVAEALSILQRKAPVNILISWIHDRGLWCLKDFEKLVIKEGRSIRIYGSSTGDLANNIKADPPAKENITRQNVLLGWIEETDRKRWLTDREISEGVIEAFHNPGQSSWVIGRFVK